MKKLYTLILGLSVASFAIGQAIVALPHQGAPHRVNMPSHSNSQRNSSTPNTAIVPTLIYIDYGGANMDDGAYVWRFSTSYTGVDTAFNYAGVGMNDVSGYTDPADPTNTFLDHAILGYPNAWPINLQVTVDSIFALITHENNSGNEDSLIMKLTNVTGTGAPGTTLLWSQRDVTSTTLSSGGNWVGSGAVVLLGYDLNYVSTPGQKLGLVFEYKDPTKLDTASIYISYLCASGCTGPSPIPSVSTFTKSWGRYPPYINSISQTANWTSGGNPAACQNMGMWIKCTVDLVSGVNEIGNGNISLLQNVPNPSNGNTTIAYELLNSSDVSLMLYDMTGKEVMNLNQGKQVAGKHAVNLNTLSLNAGIYYYTMSTEDGSKMTKKMVVTK